MMVHTERSEASWCPCHPIGQIYSLYYRSGLPGFALWRPACKPSPFAAMHLAIAMPARPVAFIICSMLQVPCCLNLFDLSRPHCLFYLTLA